MAALSEVDSSAPAVATVADSPPVGTTSSVDPSSDETGAGTGAETGADYSADEPVKWAVRTGLYNQNGIFRNHPVHMPVPGLTPRDFEPFFYHLYRDGSACGSDPEGGNAGISTPILRPNSELQRRIPEWVQESQAALSDEAAPTEAPPLEPPLSPTAGAPFMLQSDRLRERWDRTRARWGDDGSADTDDVYLDEDFYKDDDCISETEPLGPPVTENEDYYRNRHRLETPPVKVEVTSYEELNALSGQPDDLLEQLEANLESLRYQARGWPWLLRLIADLESDVIIVVEKTKKLSRRVCFFERNVEERLPELEDYKADATLLANINYRLTALEKLMWGSAADPEEVAEEDMYGPPVPPIISQAGEGLVRVGGVRVEGDAAEDTGA